MCVMCNDSLKQFHPRTRPFVDSAATGVMDFQKRQWRIKNTDWVEVRGPNIYGPQS